MYVPDAGQGPLQSAPAREPAAADAGAAANSSSDACPQGSCEVETAAASSALPRLNHRQWARTVQDLLGLDTAPDVSVFTNDAPSVTGFDNNGDALEVGQGLWADYQHAAESVAAEVARDDARLSKILPPGLPTGGEARARAFVTGFGERAFRRPLTQDEAEQFTALFEQGPNLLPGRDALSAGAELTIEAMLQAPQFVYRIEGAGEMLPDGTQALTDYEIASRLSYMLWDSMPDATLLSAAKAEKLHTADQIASQAERMLEDPRAGDKLDEFHRQLLELRRYDSLHPKGMPDGIGTAMREETEHFVHDVAVDHDGSLQTLLTANYSFVNSAIAPLYGLAPDAFGDDFVRTTLDANERAGLMTQPGFLTYRSGDTAPILRGVFINLKLLCADLPPPPVFTPPKLTGETRRERVDAVTGVGTCGETCHARMINPAGFPLEYFDDVGRYREQDNGHPVDGSASYTFSDGTRTYDGPIEWSQAVAGSLQTHECYVRHWLEFGFGRPHSDADAPLIERVAQQSRTQHLSIKQLLVALARSPSFRTRRSEEP